MPAKIYDLNRAQKRKLKKKKPALLELFQAILNSSEEPPLQVGEAIILDVEKIKSRAQYKNKQEKYKLFVESCANEIVHISDVDVHNGFSYFFCLAEDPNEVKWFFTADDIKQRNVTDAN